MRNKLPGLLPKVSCLELQASLHKHTVLVVDDERLIADTLAKIFNMAGYTGQAAYSAEEVIESALLWSPRLAILDIFLLNMNGIQLAHWLRQACPTCHVLLISGQFAAGELLEAEERAGHVWTTLPKPIHPEQVLSLAAELLQ